MREVPARLVPVVREQLEADLLAFAREVCDFRDLVDDYHGSLARFLVAPGSRKLVLGPRDSYKSSLVSVAFPMWRILRNRSLRVLIDSDLRANAKKFLTLIRWHLEANPLLLQLWGEFKREPGWTDEFFTVARPKEFPEPTMMSSGMDQVVVSLHFDLAVITDLVNNTNVNTKDQRDRTSDHRRLLAPILGDGEQVLEGTRWDDDDEYGRIMRQAAPDRPMKLLLEELLDTGAATLGRWQVFYRRWKWKGAPLIPKYTEDYIATQKEELSGYRFSANYDNDPIAAEHAKFKPEWVERFWEPPLPDGVVATIVCDPAISERAGRSRSAITAVAFDPVTRERDVLHAWAARVGDVALVRQLYDVYELVSHDFQVPVQSVGIEEIAFSKIYRTLIDQEAERRGYELPMRSLPSEWQRMQLHLRVQRLIASFEAKHWQLRRDQVELIEELERYPKAATNDLLMSLTYHLPLQTLLARLIYSAWSRERHLLPEGERPPARFDRVSMALFRPAPTEDWGYAVCGRLQRVWYLVEEGIVPRGTTLPDLATALYSVRTTYKMRTGHLLLPPHEVEARKDLIRSKLPVRLARPYEDWSAPMARLATLLDRDRFRVASYCAQFIREIESFGWPDKPAALVRTPDMKALRVLGAVQTLIWHEDPPEAQRWKQPASAAVRDWDLTPEVRLPSRHPIPTGYGYSGTRPAAPVR